MKSKKKIHIFTSDILPYPGCARSAGGDRSFQVISALRDEGHDVSYSMGLTTYLGSTQRDAILKHLSPDDLWNCEHFFEPDIVLGRVQPDIAIYCNVNSFLAVRRYARDIVQIADLNGPIHLESLLIDARNIAEAAKNPGLLQRSSEALLEKLRGIDYVITTSERQKYFWAAYCSLSGFSFQELNPLVCPISYSAPILPRNPSKKFSLVFSGGFYPWQQPDRFLRATAEYLETIEGAVFHIFGGVHTGHPNQAGVNQLIEELQRYKCVVYHGYRPIEELMATLSEAWCALELMDRNFERELAITGRTVGYLSAGTPVIYNNYSSLSELIAKYNAGWTVDTADINNVRDVIQELVKGGIPKVEYLSKNAMDLAAAEFNCKNNMASLVELCGGPIKRRQSRHVQPMATKATASLGRVLVVAGVAEGHAILELRVANPMRALQRQGLIDSFTLTSPHMDNLVNDSENYDVIIVQRTMPKWCYQGLYNLGLPFVLEVDDNLLARAAYRAWGAETELLWGLRFCTTVTAPNPRLIRMLEKYSGLRLAHKACITPNSLPFHGSKPEARRPTSILWIQSDIAALTNSRDAVVTAVEDFSVRNKLPIVLVGRNVLERPQFTYQRVLGEISFVANLQLLDFWETALGVCPLETNADRETIDFVSGKSDLKMLLFDGYGHPGVYSNAAPYTESSLLPVGHVIGNSQSEWSDALEYQYREGWRLAPELSARIQNDRHSDRVARESWHPALEASALPRPVRGSELSRAMKGFNRFDGLAPASVGYMLAHDDLRNCGMSDLDWDPIAHYGEYGEREGRSLLHSAEAHGDLLEALARETRAISEQMERTKSTPSGEEELLTRLSALESRSAELEAARDTSRAEMERLGAAAHIYRTELERIRASYSWKVTSPLRAITKPFLG